MRSWKILGSIVMFMMMLMAMLTMMTMRMMRLSTLISADISADATSQEC